jgi:GNAT superfamily N-acetyltransferase
VRTLTSVGTVEHARDVFVRSASVGDAEAIGRIHVDAWRRTYAGQMDPEFLAWMDAAHQAEMWGTRTQGPGRVAVAERAGATGGFVANGDRPDDDLPTSTGQVYAIYVDPPVQGTEVGAALMNYAVADLGASGYDAAVLWALASDPVARTFYERGGWRPDGIERDEPASRDAPVRSSA